MPISAPLPEFDTRLTKSVHAPARASALPHPLLSFYDALFTALGPQHWWPGRTPFEVIVGAILTQNTSWGNVERAIANLRREKLLSPAAVERVSAAKLAACIRSSGYFRQKAKKLKAFVQFLRKNYGGSLARMFRTPTAELRRQLLAVYGLGPETADSILLYAGGHRVFVVDAYTRRILERHGQGQPRDTYDEIRGRFERHLPGHVALYNEYHALLVRAGKDWCRAKKPRCQDCPLGPFLAQTEKTGQVPHGSTREETAVAP